MRFFKILNLGDCLRGKVCKVQYPNGHSIEYSNFWQFVNHLRGKSFRVEMPHDRPKPDLDALRSCVAADPGNARARMYLGASLATSGSLEEGYREYLEAIKLLSNGESMDDDFTRLSARSSARYMAAKILEQMSRTADAREYWQGCADDIRAVSSQKHLRENPIYMEALAKLDDSSTA